MTIEFGLSNDGAPQFTKSDPGAFRPFSRTQKYVQAIYGILRREPCRTFTVVELTSHAAISYSRAYNACKNLVKCGAAERDDRIWPINRGRRELYYYSIAVRYVAPGKNSNKKW